jgi:hypothetical protein
MSARAGAEKSSKDRTFGPEKREAGGRSPPKRATVIGIKLKPAHKRGYIVINQNQLRYY